MQIIDDSSGSTSKYNAIRLSSTSFRINSHMDINGLSDVPLGSHPLWYSYLVD